MKIAEIINENLNDNQELDEDLSSMMLVDKNKIVDLFGDAILKDLDQRGGTLVFFDRDKHGRNWKVLKTPDGNIYIERDHMLEGDSIIFEGDDKALVGVIAEISGDRMVIEGGMFPIDSINEKELGDRRSFTVRMEFEDGGKVTRVFLAKDKQEALHKAMSWAKNEYDPEQGVEARIIDEGLSTTDIMLDPLGSDMDKKELLGLIHDEIEKLKEPRRSIAKLWADGKTNREISDELGLSTGHVGFMLRSALNKLRHRVRSKPGYKHMSEAKYHGREVKLGKPMAGDVKKYKVYVKDPKTGNIKKINFGDKGMEIKRDDPERRKNFRARHGCGTPRASNRMKAAYWSCRMWSKKPVSKILKGK